MDRESEKFASDLATLWVAHYATYFRTGLSDQQVAKKVAEHRKVVDGTVDEVLGALAEGETDSAQDILNTTWEMAMFEQDLAGLFRKSMKPDVAERHVMDDTYSATCTKSEKLWRGWLKHLNRKYKAKLEYNPDGDMGDD